VGLKLIRDKKPDMAWDNESAKSLIVRIEDDRAFEVLLLQKLFEELGEFLKELMSGTVGGLLDEAADLYEVILTILETQRLDPDQLEAVRRMKYASEGGFNQRLAWGYTERGSSDAGQTDSDHL
jgi:predicted house-cleaning noncanonical NTP pyrophosphatase (MazG superfamily)